MRNEIGSQIYITTEPCSQLPCKLTPSGINKQVPLSIFVHTYSFCVSIHVRVYLCIAMVLNRGRFSPPGDIGQCLETFLVVTTCGEGDAAGI